MIDMVLVGWALLVAGAVALAGLWLRDAGTDETDETDDDGRGEREAAHAATLPTIPPAAVAALQPDAPTLPDEVPVVPGPPADPAAAVAEAIEHLASAIASEQVGCEPHIADQWKARAYRELHRLTADQLVEVLLVELTAAATCRADELLSPAPATPQES